MDRRLEEQLAYLRGDERLIERARLTLEMTLDERMAMMAAMCRAAAEMPRLVEREPFTPDAEAALRRLGRGT